MKIRWMHAAFVSALTSASVASGQTPAGPARTDEGLIYSALVGATGEYWISDSTTVSGGSPRKHAGEYAEAWDDFDRKRSTRVALPPDIRPENLQLHRGSIPIAMGCKDVPRVTFSQIGFNKDRSKAVVETHFIVGKGPFPGCGFYEFDIVYFERGPDGAWRTAPGGVTGIS